MAAKKEPKKAPKNPHHGGSRRRAETAKQLTERELKLCHLVAQNKKIADAAREMGINKTLAYKMLDRRHVKAYTARLLPKVEERALEAEVDEIAKHLAKTVTRKRAEVYVRLFELMQLDPEKTNRNAAAQVNAGKTLAQVLGMLVERTADLTPQFKEKTDEELDYFATHGEWPKQEDAERVE